MIPLAVEGLAGCFAEDETTVVEPDGETLKFKKEVPAAAARLTDAFIPRAGTRASRVMASRLCRA